MSGRVFISRSRQLLERLFRDGLSDVDLERILPKALPEEGLGATWVVGAGKAAARMAAALESSWEAIAGGLVVVPDGYAKRLRHVRVVEASHPVPDGRGLSAAAEIVKLIQNAPEDDLIIGLWSGGASALMVAPIPGLDLAAKQAMTSQLLASGAPIQDINTVRKHVSLVKGGKLAKLAGRRRMLNFIVSDVVGDDLAVIGSGPTVPDPTTNHDALRILKKYGVVAPTDVLSSLELGEFETPSALGANVLNRLVLSPSDLLHAVEKRALAAGCRVINLGDAIEGEARDIAAEMADKVFGLVDDRSGQDTLLLSGGEATVTLSDDGERIGGPNLEFALALAIAIDGIKGVWALAADTDGRDGVSGVAGAFVGPHTLAQAKAQGIDILGSLRAHSSKAVFEGLGDLFDPGPTGTNLNDIRMILVEKDAYS